MQHKSGYRLVLFSSVFFFSNPIVILPRSPSYSYLGIRRIWGRYPSLQAAYYTGRPFLISFHESEPNQHSMKNRRAVRLMNPLCAIKIEGKQEPGGEGTTCDDGLSRRWKIKVCGKNIYISPQMRDVGKNGKNNGAVHLLSCHVHGTHVTPHFINTPHFITLF